MRNIFIIPIEPLDNRYTKQWFDHIPQLFHSAFPDDLVINVAGNVPAYDAPQAGAFFDFNATCAYKANQSQQISEYFRTGKVKNDDVFFFTDAWNQTVHFVKYMSELAGINIKMYGIWHAGAYDPTDILGFKIKNKQWVSELERSMFYAFDKSFFGTEQHKNKFLKNLNLNYNDPRAIVAGYPLEYLKDQKTSTEKQNIVVFPHRLNEDKAPEIFDFLKFHVRNVLGRNDISFLRTQDMNMSKEMYYEFLGKCKVIFSANKHENLGIGTFEAVRAGCLPLLPNKLSYAEMYDTKFLYDCPEDFYSNPGKYIDHLAKMVILFIDKFEEFDTTEMIDRIQYNFFSANKIIEEID